jgi:hypothetical protein
MKVRLLTLMAGPRGVFNPGAVLDLPDQEALDLINGRHADAIKQDLIETADRMPQVETAAKRRRKG